MDMACNQIDETWIPTTPVTPSFAPQGRPDVHTALRKRYTGVVRRAQPVSIVRAAGAVSVSLKYVLQAELTELHRQLLILPLVVPTTSAFLNTSGIPSLLRNFYRSMLQLGYSHRSTARSLAAT